MLPGLPVTGRLPALTMLVPILLPLLPLSPPRAAATVSHAPARAPPRPRAGPRAGLVAPGAGARTPPHRPRHRIKAWPPRPGSGACDHEIHRHSASLASSTSSESPLAACDPETGKALSPCHAGPCRLAAPAELPPQSKALEVSEVAVFTEAYVPTEGFSRGHPHPRQGKGLGDLDVGAVQYA